MRRILSFIISGTARTTSLASRTPTCLAYPEQRAFINNTLTTTLRRVHVGDYGQYRHFEGVADCSVAE
jgi:hypothetical protein